MTVVKTPSLTRINLTGLLSKTAVGNGPVATLWLTYWRPWHSFEAPHWQFPHWQFPHWQFPHWITTLTVTTLTVLPP